MWVMHLCVLAQTLLRLPDVCMEDNLQINLGNHASLVMFRRKVTAILTRTAVSPHN